MLDYTTKRRKRTHAIDLINSPLLKMLLKSSPVSHSISYSISLKGSLQASPIKWILSFLKGKAIKTSMR